MVTMRAPREDRRGFPVDLDDEVPVGIVPQLRMPLIWLEPRRRHRVWVENRP